MAIPLHELNSDGTLTLPLVSDAVAAGVGGGGATVVVAAPTGVAATDTAAIKAACAKGGTIQLQAGVYAVTNGSVILPNGMDTAIVGMGREATVIRGQSATGDTITVGTGFFKTRLQSLTIDSAVTRTAGYAINNQDAQMGIGLIDVLLDHPYNGVALSSGRNYIDHCQIANIVNDGVVIGGGFASANINELFAYGPTATLCNSVVHIKNAAAGVSIANSDLELASAGCILINPVAANSDLVQSVQVANTNIDAGGGVHGQVGVAISGDGQIVSVKIHDCWIAGFVTSAIQINNTHAGSTDLNIHDNNLTSTSGFATLWLNQFAGHVKIHDNFIHGNSVHGIATNATAPDVTIMGNTITDNSGTADGIQVGAGTYRSGSFITNNMVTGNGGGQIVGTGTNLTISNNFP